MRVFDQFGRVDLVYLLSVLGEQATCCMSYLGESQREEGPLCDRIFLVVSALGGKQMELTAAHWTWMFVRCWLRIS